MKQEINLPIIKCPHCGYEYHLSEIFYPEDFTGTPDQIIKDALGKILYLDYKEGKEPVPQTQFICDGCNKPFIASIGITVKSKEEVEELDFSEEYVSLLD